MTSTKTARQTDPVGAAFRAVTLAIMKLETEYDRLRVVRAVAKFLDMPEVTGDAPTP